MADPTLFPPPGPPGPSSHPAHPVVPALHTTAAVPSAAAVVAAGWNPPEWFDRRYPRAVRVKLVGGLEVALVRLGSAAPGLRAEFDAFYRRFLAAPVEFPLSTPSTEAPDG